MWRVLLQVHMGAVSLFLRSGAIPVKLIIFGHTPVNFSPISSTLIKLIAMIVILPTLSSVPSAD